MLVLSGRYSCLSLKSDCSLIMPGLLPLIPGRRLGGPYAPLWITAGQLWLITGNLRNEMALPTDVLPTVLTLMDHLHRSRRDLRRLAEALDDQPEDVRRAILASYRRRAQDGGRME